MVILAVPSCGILDTHSTRQQVMGTFNQCTYLSSMDWNRNRPSKLLIIQRSVRNKLGLVDIKAHPSRGLPQPLLPAQVWPHYKCWLRMISHRVGPTQCHTSAQYDLTNARAESGISCTMHQTSCLDTVGSKNARKWWFVPENRLTCFFTSTRRVVGP